MPWYHVAQEEVDDPGEQDREPKGPSAKAPKTKPKGGKPDPEK